MRQVLIALLLLSSAQAFAQTPAGSDVEAGKEIWK
jgi:hypothetical protein